MHFLCWVCVRAHLCVHHSLKASDLPLPSSTAYYAAICFAQCTRQQTAVDMPWITKQLFLGLYPLLLNIHMSVYTSLAAGSGKQIVTIFYLWENVLFAIHCSLIFCCDIVIWEDPTRHLQRRLDSLFTLTGSKQLHRVLSDSFLVSGLYP